MSELETAVKQIRELLERLGPDIANTVLDATVYHGWFCLFRLTLFWLILTILWRYLWIKWDSWEEKFRHSDIKLHWIGSGLLGTFSIIYLLFLSDLPVYLLYITEPLTGLAMRYMP